MFIAGWDVGVTLNPAFVLGFISQMPGEPSQLRILMEVLAPGMAMSEFAPLVAQKLDKAWASWRLKEFDIIHTADPAGASRQGVTGKTAFDEARKHGFLLRRSQNALQPRISCVTRFLMGWAIDDEAPLLVVNRQLCPVVCEAFTGGYAYRIDKKLTGNAHRVREPRKDGYSHPMDAVQYLCLEAEKWIDGNANSRPVDRLSRQRSAPQFQTRYV